ncbi:MULTISPECIES: hypothetical protein [unclassified Acinetobacter]|uniref:hypothetical protein n=1 Tax=unclassified Acinetobacter TaxID=196816 RepID=UPI0015D139C2|nr:MULTISPECIES: hypothetical protein [unclassified Acinetobacter]
MTQFTQAKLFRQSCLAAAVSMFAAPSVYALQDLSDEALSATTGEGVALTLENFKMVFQGPNDRSTASSYASGMVDPGKNDTGFIRIIPTGENYEQLGQRAYDKIYKAAYVDAYQQGRVTGYNGVYDSTFLSSKSTYETNNATRITNETITTYSTEYRGRLVQSYLESPTMKAYYDQRYKDYYNGSSWLMDFEEDGTTKESIIPGLKEKSQTAALKNTYEMIELLYGNNSTGNLPTTSTFYKNYVSGKITRSNLIDPTKDAQLNAKAAETLNQLATDYAKLEAQKASDSALATVKKNAEITAKQIASTATVSSLRSKADVFIYGLALSNSKDKNGKSSLATRYTDQGFNWGTAENPWLFHAGNQDVEQFAKDNKGNVGYLAIEAPLKKIAADDASNNIKLGLWMDVFSRSLNSSNVVDPITGAPTSGLDKDYRLRTQIVANGLSFNGSQVRIFQTLKSTNTNYNQTLGLASLIRINTNDRAESLSINDGDLDARGMRISTAARPELDDGTAATPAMDRSAAPIFHETEGLYLYSPNINLVLGNMYQPFIVGSEGRNIILEVTRIPNVPSIYSKIYTYYTDIAGNTTGTSGLNASDFKGSTCNVYSCGTELKANSSDATALYQGRNATHSSIAIGTVERLPGNLLNAKSTDTATGVVFKGVNGQSTNLGSVAIDGVLIQHLKIRTTGL